ncbi:free fatty acid receptor 4-like [Daktulosphaira vitifoliae]|uniref:free fatty acid receptor 4-like n=1 Tax=Daktulosphaira vitifoliae TaxID=58002 RepID=UPI0021AA23EC|nr:free fatty acid receptor 4-like [Daktulosphaira vitifoliae]XP_050546772.1 free fatty acid receptor 4-like [Daktulosphaira vitifoliae]
MSLFNTSYLLGNDTVGGWGLRYFFTFYSEFGDEKTESTIEVTVLMVIFAASVIANITIAWAVLRYKEMRTVTNCFLLNLTVADLLFAITTPILAYVRIWPNWPFGDLVCRLLPYSQFVCGFVLLWTLTLISMDRHRCIVVPPYRSRLTPKRAAWLTVFTWLIASVVFMPVPFWFHQQTVHNGDINICTLVFPKNDTFRLSIVFTVTVVSLSCLLPLSLFVYHYQRIFHKLNKTRRRLQQSATYRTKTMSQNSLSPPSSNSIPQVLVRHEELRYKKHVRVVRVLLINVIVVLVMWLPITVVMCLIYVDGSRDTDDTNFFLRSHHFIMSLLFALLNTVVNPILYGVLSENFRKCFARLWFISKRRRAMNRELLDNMSKGCRTPSNGNNNSALHPGSSASVVELPPTNCW